MAAAADDVLTLDESDLGSVAEAVNAFAKRELAPFAEHPELSIDGDTMQELTSVAAELGLIGGEQSALGLWAAAGDPIGMRLSQQTLARIAEVRAGVGLHLHSLALGDYIRGRLGLPRDGATIPMLRSRGGLARGALAVFLAGETPCQSDHALIADTLVAADRRGVARAAEGWQGVVAPVLCSDGGLQWRSMERAQLEAVAVDGQVGLDEAPYLSIKPGVVADVALAAMSDKDARRLLIEALAIEAIAAMSLGLGACRAALRKARAYAAERLQGGHTIDRHPAVQLLMGRVDANVGTVAAIVDSVRLLPTTLAGLNTTLRLRAVVHPLLCRAATDALQVFGGYGYMRDFGLERILRDNQQLKNCFATPREIELFLGAQGVVA